MRYRIYKALDNPPSFVGLKGSYIKFGYAGIGIALVVGLLVGSATNGLIGVIVFAVMVAAAYLGIMAMQARFTERERMKWLSSKKLMDVIVFTPEPFSNMARQRLENAEKLVKKK